MNEEKVWCRHREYSKYWDGLWTYCPFCGTKKPPEPKKLAQILFEAFQSQCKSAMKWDSVASDLIKRGSQAQAEAVVKLVQDLFLNAESWSSIEEKLEGML